MVRPTDHSNRSRKRSFSETIFKPKEFENAGFVFKSGRKKVLKTKIFENDDPTIIFLNTNQK